MTKYIGDQNPVILFYKRNIMNLEFAGAIIFSLIILYFLPRILAPVSVDAWVLNIKTALYPVIATISGALLGFVITGVSIILAFSDSHKLDRVRKSKGFEDIYKVYFRAIKYLALTTVISVFGIVISYYATYMFYLVFISSILSIVGLYRCMWVLERITGIVHKKEVI